MLLLRSTLALFLVLTFTLFFQRARDGLPASRCLRAVSRVRTLFSVSRVRTLLTATDTTYLNVLSVKIYGALLEVLPETALLPAAC
jgi:hypothetical protein